MTSDESSWPRGESAAREARLRDAFLARQRLQFAVARLLLARARGWDDRPSAVRPACGARCAPCRNWCDTIIRLRPDERRTRVRRVRPHPPRTRGRRPRAFRSADGTASESGCRSCARRRRPWCPPGTRDRQPVDGELNCRSCALMPRRIGQTPSGQRCSQDVRFHFVAEMLAAPR